MTSTAPKQPAASASDQPILNFWLISLVFIVAAAVRWAFLTGPAGTDDTRYMNAAVALAQGNAPAHLDHANVRAIFLLWAAFWSRLGLLPTQLVYSQIIASALQAAALFWVATLLTDRRSAFVASILWVFYPVELVYGGILFPDQLALTLGLVAVGLCLLGLRQPSLANTRYLFLSGVVAGLAYTAKEPYLLVFPILFTYTLAQLGVRRPAWRSLAALVSGVLLILVLEHVFFAVWTGDWKYKYHALARPYGAAGSERVPVTVGGLLYYVREVIANFEVSGAFVWLLPVGVVAGISLVRHKGMVLIWTVAFLLFLQFGTTSLRDYKLMPMQPRYVTPIVVLLFVPLGITVVRMASQAPLRRLGTALLLLPMLYQGLIVARNRITRGLYYTDVTASAVEVTATPYFEMLQGKDVYVPAGFRDRLPGDLQKGTPRWKEESVAQLEAMATDTSCQCSFLVPQMDYAMPLGATLERAGFKEIEIRHPITKLDDLLKHSGSHYLQARSRSRHTASLYVGVDSVIAKTR